MSMVGKTLLLVLLAKVASLGSATNAPAHRRVHNSLMGLKAGRSASVSRVISEVSALLQAHHDDPTVRHEVGTTNEDSREVFNAALGEGIAEIEGQVQPTITASHDAAQAEINRRVEDLVSASTNLLNPKETADAADAEWIECGANEKGMAKDVEDANAALDQATNSRKAACQLRDDSRHFDYQMDPANMQFRCDISLSPEHNCDVQWEEFQYDVDLAFETLVDDVDVAVEVYAGHVQACHLAEVEERAKEASARRAIERYEDQHQRCLDRHVRSHLAMCNFEGRYKQKCEVVISYQTLMTEIDTVEGNAYSHPDRVQEWTMTAVTTCMLRKVIENGMVETAHVEECEANVNTDHLNLERQEQRVAGLIAAPWYLAGYNCAETNLTFSGETWNIPASAPEPPAPSASYERVPFHPEFPFPFCHEGLAKDIEDAMAALEQSSNNRRAACQLAEDNRYFDHQMDPENMQFQCDISLSPEHNCDVQWEEFQYDVDLAFETLIDDVDVAVSVYGGHVHACQLAQADERAKEESVRRAIERYGEWSRPRQHALPTPTM